VNLNSHTSLEALDAPDAYDVCVIGSGVAGTILATTLARRGVRALLLESGRGMLAWLTDGRLKSLARYDYTGDTNYPLIRTTSRILGGNSNFWTGRSERLHPSDFEQHPYTPPDNPWPIQYADLERYYDVAEDLLRVRGGPRSDFTPPRRAPLPLPGKPDVTYLKNLCARFGAEVEDSATATPSKTLRIFNVQKEILPGFLKSGYGTLVTGVTVTRLVAGPDQRIESAEIRTLDGRVAKARAKIFVICCGGIESSRLLLLSASEAFPNGIGNAHDMVGRGFNDHPSMGFYSSIPHSWGSLVPTNKIARTHQYYNTFRAEGLGAMIPVFRQAWLLPNHILPFTLVNVPRNTLSILSRVAKAAFFIGAGIEMKISLANRVTLSKSRQDLFGRPIAHLIFNYADEDRALIERTRALILSWFSQIGATGIREAPIAYPRHFQGACRMGSNARTSVVDADLRLHESQNLYLCGCDVFVTGGGMGPTLSIAALALRLADRLVDRLQHA
jgi:choline dehydrogenase-like flavoprotein